MLRKATIERTPCFGQCPVYSATVDSDGRVVYRGEMFVRVGGLQTWKLSSRRMQRLEELFEPTYYLSFRDEYTDSSITDLPSCTTSVEYEDGHSKSVYHYHGDRSAPEELTELEDEIDWIIGTEKYKYKEVFPPHPFKSKTYLLTWNPNRWEWVNIEDRSDDVLYNGHYETSWSCRNHKVAPGDRVFLMRQGEEPRGIFASGTAISEVFEDRHWDEQLYQAGHTTTFVQVRLDVLIDPDRDEESILSRDELLHGSLSGGPWDTQSSGVEIPPYIAAELQKEWTALTAHTGYARTDPPEEEFEIPVYLEGATEQIRVNRYERNAKARQACIKHYGTNCCVCRFDFGKVYGELGEGFIHVHHLISLSEIGEEYEVDPVNDLRPVCPNCHAMIHRRSPAYTLEEVQSAIRKDLFDCS